MEKAYRAWGHELTTDDTPLEAGLGFAVAWDKPERLPGARRSPAPAGRAAHQASGHLRARRPRGLPWGDEAIFHDGRLAGSVTSAGYGHTIGRAVAMGYLATADGARGIDARFVTDAKFELEIADDRFTARGSLRAPYDPQAPAGEELEETLPHDRPPRRAVSPDPRARSRRR